MPTTYEELIKQRNTLANENLILKKALAELVDATEDKNGQFRAWHQHLKQTTSKAKELLK